MKITVERDRLVAALAPVFAIARGKTTIPILSHILLTADGGWLQLLGHDTMACTQTSCPAEIAADGAGAVAVPADQLQKLVRSMPEGCQVVMESTDTEIAIRFGRSRYKLAVLPAGDFPSPLAPANAVSFELQGEEVLQLFKQTRPFVETDSGRHYLCGVQLREQQKGKSGRLIAEASDGKRLMRRSIEIKPQGMKAVIVPTFAVDQILDLAAEGATFNVGDTLISIAAGAVVFTSKLIDGTFPDLDRAIPQLNNGCVTCDRAELLDAIERLAAIKADGTLALDWGGSDGLLVSLRGGDAGGEGAEPVACELTELKPGRIGIARDLFRELLATLDGEMIELHISDPGSPIRIVQPKSADLVAVQMPFRL